MTISDIYRDKIESFDEVKKILDRNNAATIIYLRGNDIDKILSTLQIPTDQNLEDYIYLRNKIAYDIAKRNNAEDMAVANRLQKLYTIRCIQQETNKEFYPKGEELATIGYIYFNNFLYDQGIKYLTLAFIDDIEKHGKDTAERSYAYNFLLSTVYGESLAKSISEEIYNRIQSYKRKQKCQHIYRLEDILTMGDILDVAPPYEFRKIFEIENKNHFIELLNRVKNLKNEKEGKGANDGSALEALSQYLFQCISGCHFIARDKLNDSNEFDLIFRIVGNGSRLHSMFGDYLLVECKEYRSKTIGSSIIRSFITNMLSIGAKGGILVSINGISGRNKDKYGNLEIKKAYHRHGIIILSVTLDDFEKIANGKDFFCLLMKKYEGVRFDNSSRNKNS